MPDVVHTLELFRGGEFDRTRVFGSLDGARKEASRLLHESITREDFVQAASVYDVEEFFEFLDSMKELYAQEDYHAFVECWDEWVSGDYCEGPTPFNFDISERTVE